MLIARQLGNRPKHLGLLLGFLYGLLVDARLCGFALAVFFLLFPDPTLLGARFLAASFGFLFALG
jgi:hypothetical protein